MFYLIIFIIHFPILFLYRFTTFFFTKHSDTGLVIQTAKLGDCLNTSPLIQAIGKIDVICSNDCSYLFSQYKNVRKVYAVNQYKSRGVLGKLTLAYILFMNRYQEIYILQPNSLNLFLSLMAMPKIRRIVFPTYKNSWLARFLCKFSGCTMHTKSDLTIKTYLRMSGKLSAPEKKFYPTPKPPRTEILSLIKPNLFTIGIALSAGNKLKELPISLVCQLITIFDELMHANYNLLFFGINGEEKKLKDLESSGCLNGIKYKSIIGEIDLNEAAWMLAHIRLFISSDTALSYLADSFDTPVINFMGPCNWREQRPLGGNALIIKSKIAPFSFTFDAPYRSEISPDELYSIENKEKIWNFLLSLNPTKET